MTTAPYVADPASNADLVTRAAARPALDHDSLNSLVADFITAFVRLVVSIVSWPISGLVERIVNERLAAERAAMYADLRTELLADLKGLAADFAANALDAEEGDREDALYAEIDDLKTRLKRVEHKPAYPFAWSFAGIFCLVGGLAGWLLYHHRLSHAVGLVSDPLYAVAYGGIVACLAGAIGAAAGWAIDSFRPRRAN